MDVVRVMQTGRLNRRVEVQELSSAQAADGASVLTWSTVKTVWASIVPASGNESTARGNAVKATATHGLRMRYKAFPALTMRHRFKHGTRIFLIASIDQVTGWAEEFRCGLNEQA